MTTSNSRVPDSPVKSTEPEASAPAASDDPRAATSLRARERIAAGKAGDKALELIDSFRALLIEAADRIQHWQGEINFERGYLRESKGRRATLARLHSSNAHREGMTTAERDRLSTLNRDAVKELNDWCARARENIAEYERNIKTTRQTIRDLWAALALVYREAFYPFRVPEYKDLNLALGFDLPDGLLPKTALTKLKSIAIREYADATVAARWPHTAEMLRFLADGGETIGPEIH